jgi:cytochrome c biogenesis protein
MENLRCECGHENPFGTKLCAKCGRPLTEEEKNQKFSDMRYEGSAIRSKTYNKSLVDKVWNFFSSVKVGVTLIVLNLIAAALGTIFPQEFFIQAGTDAEKAEYYEKMYGTLGKVYYELGLSDAYGSWWFQILVGLLGVSIIVASIDRGLPLHKSLTNQRVKRHESFFKRQRIISEVAWDKYSDEQLNNIEQHLKKARFTVRRDGHSILAEKGRLARYGPYINHLGLIIFLIGVMLHSVPSLYINKSMWLYEDDILAVPGMPGYYIENKQFIMETYDNEPQGEQVRQGVNTVAKNFQTNVVLYKAKEGAIAGQNEELEVVKEYAIRVNHPLKHDGYAVYQMDFGLNELKTMTFDLTNKASGEALGRITIDLLNPTKVYEVDENTRVELLSYTPDFTGFENGEPKTETQFPYNPAFVFKMVTPEVPEGEMSFVAIQETLEPLGETKHKMSFVGVETRNKSGLAIQTNKTIPVLIVGGAIFMLGLVIGSYFSHRRIWIEQLADGTIRYAAHTNKNWLKIKKELDTLVKATNLPPYIDRIDAERELEETVATESKKVDDNAPVLQKADEVDSEIETNENNLLDNRKENDNDNLNEEGDSSK